MSPETARLFAAGKGYEAADTVKTIQMRKGKNRFRGRDERSEEQTYMLRNKKSLLMTIAAAALHHFRPGAVGTIPALMPAVMIIDIQ